MNKKNKGYEKGTGFTTKHNFKDYCEIHEFDFKKFLAGDFTDGKYMLDIGCGNAYFLEEVKRRFPKINVIGLDRKNYQHSSSVEFICADARELPFKDNSMDIVVSTTVSNWIRNGRLDFYREIARVLKKDGKGIVYPNHLGFEELEQHFGGRFKVRNLYKDRGSIKVEQLVIGL